MLRIATTYLLVAAVLICPQLCLGEAAGSPVTPCRAGGCTCADHDGPSRDQPPQPSDESEPDCLCRGAIMDGCRPTELDLSSSLAIDWLVDSAILSSMTVSLADTSEPPHQFPPFSTGRDVCVLACALLL